jgi:hypothetical protein
MCRHAAPTIGPAMLLLLWRMGLGKLNDAGLAWYNGMGLTKSDECTLSSCDDEHGLSTPTNAPDGGLHPCHRNALRVSSAPARSALAAKDLGKRSAKKPAKRSLTLWYVVPSSSTTHPAT